MSTLCTAAPTPATNARAVWHKSHAACYAYVAFQTAYLKCHYPSEFMAALLTSVLDNTDKVIEYSGECARLGIKVLPPDVNVSNGGFTADDNGQIRFGLNAIKNVGRNLIENGRISLTPACTISASGCMAQN